MLSPIFSHERYKLWLALLTLMQEVQGSNPGAAPPTFGQFGAQNPSPYPAKSQRMARAFLKKAKLGPKDCGSESPTGSKKKKLGGALAQK